MAVSDDLLFQRYSTVGSSQELVAVSTIVSAEELTTDLLGYLTIVTGTTAIATIPSPFTGWGTVVLVFTNANPGGVTTGGNIANAVDPAQYVPVILIWNPLTSTWYAK